MFLMFDEKTEELAREIALLLPPGEVAAVP
jgi:hypothetical protein